MKLLTIALTDWCNCACAACPNRECQRMGETGMLGMSRDIRVVPETGEMVGSGSPLWGPAIDQRPSAGHLLAWLEKFASPDEWLIELTGGEPTLYPQFGELLAGLNEAGYSGVIKTNGSNAVENAGRFLVVASWHIGHEFPKTFDIVALVQNPRDSWIAKAKRCHDGGHPYRLMRFEPGADHLDLDYRFRTDGAHHFTSCCHISAWGKISKCSKDPAGWGRTVQGMSPICCFDDVRRECPGCKNLANVEVFLPEELRAKILADWEAAGEAGGPAPEKSPGLEGAAQ